MNSGGGGLLNQSSKMSHSQQVQMMNHQQMHMMSQQSHHLGPPQPQPHHHMHPMGNSGTGMSNNNMGMNHLAATGQPLQMSGMQNGMYDHHQNMNGMMGGTPKMNEQVVYLPQATTTMSQPHLSVIPPQNPYMTTPMNRSMGVSTVKDAEVLCTSTRGPLATLNISGWLSVLGQ